MFYLNTNIDICLKVILKNSNTYHVNNNEKINRIGKQKSTVIPLEINQKWKYVRLQ